MREDSTGSDRLPGDWERTLGLITPILALADSDFVQSIRTALAHAGIESAVEKHDTPTIYDWMLASFQYQGMSDRSVEGYAQVNGAVSWSDLDASLGGPPRCSRLKSYWHFDGCGYRKGARTCDEPQNLHDCPVPTLPLRNGRLSQNAYALFLFMRDVCDGDFVGWVDGQFERVVWQDGQDGRALADALLLPMGHIFGVSNKVLSMTMADLLIGAGLGRPRWLAAGASMVAIDTLVHNLLHRTGTLARHHAEHPYGDRCYHPGSCADIVHEIAQRVDAKSINAAYPACFPRLVQHAIWSFCAQGRWNVCNGNQIDDRVGCSNSFCICWDRCERKGLGQL